jgi:hypothetical protein
MLGTANQPIDVNHKVLIRLHYLKGMNPESSPAIVCCGGRMDFHGQPMNRAWVKLGDTIRIGNRHILLAEPLTGWPIGDRILLTTTSHDPLLGNGRETEGPHTTLREPGRTQTEERFITAIQGAQLTVDRPVIYEPGQKRLIDLMPHEDVVSGKVDRRVWVSGEVANLSRNDVVEFASPAGVRGHTIYPRHSAGSIGYAEFRHLGKENVLGRYPVHFHLIGDTMRGTSVLGASIWDSQNHCMAIHGWSARPMSSYPMAQRCAAVVMVGPPPGHPQRLAWIG